MISKLQLLEVLLILARYLGYRRSSEEEYELRDAFKKALELPL